MKYPGSQRELAAPQGEDSGAGGDEDMSPGNGEFQSLKQLCLKLQPAKLQPAENQSH